jgi:hypothetical protein
MSKASIKDNIVNLLENIIKRTEIIERQSGSRNIMEIDIAMDDVRLLYRQLEMLRKQYETSDDQEFFDAGRSHTKNITYTKEVRSVNSVDDNPQEPEKHKSLDPKPNIEFAPEVEKEIPDTTKHTSIDPKPNIEFVPDVEKDIPAKPEPATIEPQPEPPRKDTSLDPKPNTPFIPDVEKDIPQKPQPATTDQPEKPLEVSPDKKPNIEFAPEVEKEVPERKQSLDPKPNTEFSPDPSDAPDISSSNGHPGGKEKHVSQVPEPRKRDHLTLGDQYESKGNLLYERLAKMKEDQSIGARMQFVPINNLRDAIGINEKFLFVNELFNGDLKAYNESIHQLNSAPSIHEAFEYINRLTDTFSWDGQRSANTIEKFANLVQRRHMAHS